MVAVDDVLEVDEGCCKVFLTWDCFTNRRNRLLGPEKFVKRRKEFTSKKVVKLFLFEFSTNGSTMQSSSSVVPLSISIWFILVSSDSRCSTPKPVVLALLGACCRSLSFMFETSLVGFSNDPLCDVGFVLLDKLPFSWACGGLMSGSTVGMKGPFVLDRVAGLGAIVVGRKKVGEAELD